MAKTRALMTDTERERLAGMADVEDIKVYQAKSRVRRRIEEELTFDVEILEENHSDLLEELRDVVCESVTEGESEGGKDTAKGQEANTEATRAGHRHEEPDMKANVDLEVTEAVESVAASWEDSPERLETRKQAAAVVLQRAIDSGDAIGKSGEIVADVRRAFPVDGQNEETYWRKNLRPALKEFGEYNEREHGYVVEPGEEF